ncbi:MSMEG_0568 family radical SAM protein [Aquihabitans sp. G128]|uniref:MSMEG_0568 family radical SAM protein n=1 Tax=Aquihabitans sp. G128 TaxID=2849779 RepID=UPI001C2504C8|nr:MSMEG_0568 family radical SAM protein [Aquihabitans sp. G128]QXC61038.1 MSMEG_0568 family radical SAM protein [Aquihabitans sp. G128]
MVDVTVRADLALRGVRVAAPVVRSKGAGPTDDGHVVVDGVAMALPLAADSPWSIVDGLLFHDEDPVDGLGMVAAVDRPAFYDLATAEGVPYEQLARLHGSTVLATTVVQTCIRYGVDTRCRFCAIEESLAAGSTTRVKTPAQLAEVAEAAVRLDGITQLVMTSGTSAAADRGARYLARCAGAVHEAVPHLPIQVQCEPPADPFTVFRDLRDNGVTAIGIHIEALDQAVRERWTPGKAEVSIAEYEHAWQEAVRVFGWNRVSTYVLVGLGEDPDELVAGCARLVDMGVYPFVVPFRPIEGTLAVAEGATAPSPDVLVDVTGRVASLLQAAGMSGADQGAGCAACGACSALSVVGG